MSLPTYRTVRIGRDCPHCRKVMRIWAKHWKELRQSDPEKAALCLRTATRTFRDDNCYCP